MCRWIRRTITLALLSALLAAAPAMATMHFAIIQPGQPGTPEEARPVVDALAHYLTQKLGINVEGEYVNDPQQALKLLGGHPPQWAIVSLPFYVAHAEPLRMTPIASSRPGGRSQESWRLLTGREGVKDWQGLTGRVLGTMLFEPDAAACLLFGRPAGELPFTLEGTAEPLRAVRAAARGKTAGVVLDRPEYESMQAFPTAGKLRELKASADLPTSPVVWLGPPDERSTRLQAVLVEMQQDPAAADLLQSLQTAGFAPPDPALSHLRMNNGRCPE